MTRRLDRHEYFLHVARLVSLRSTCVRRTVGCVLVDERNHILSTGYNGGIPGAPHCLDHPCAGANDEVGDTTRCESIHAELSALLQCPAREKVRSVYCTDLPCERCATLLCTLPNLFNVIYVRPYIAASKRIFNGRGVHMTQLSHLYQLDTEQLFNDFERTRD